MKKISLLLSFILLFSALSWAQGQYKKKIVRPTKNVILMIPDGCSVGVFSVARWYQIYNNLGGENLAVDPYFCGTVKTFSSNAPIGDSAPTTSCYMTGMPQQTGNVSIYPPADPGNDLVPVDPSRAYQPLTTILEAAKIERKKAVGLVATVEFPHATPADCSAHHYNRNKYDQIGSQMVYQNLDVVYAGGTSIISEDMKNHFKTTGTKYIQDDYRAFKAHNNDSKIWALFGEKAQVYDIDRNPNEVPSLEEMTTQAIAQLSKNENGFFLMVEGSKIDWSAHANDGIGMVTEYLAFDKAVKAAIEFAKKDGNTTVLVFSDHGNSGLTIGNKSTTKGYDKKTLNEFFANFSKFKRTSNGLEEMLEKATPEQFAGIFKQYTGIDLTAEELATLTKAHHQKAANYMEVGSGINMNAAIVDIMNSRTLFGYTTGGHTGEEVLLAAYHPLGDVPSGMNTNIEMNKYLFDVVGLSTPLEEMTKKIFAKHADVFTGLTYSIDKKDPNFPVLTVKKGKNTLTVPAFKSVAYLNGNVFDLGSVTVYMDKNDTFYLPANLAEKLN